MATPIVLVGAGDTGVEVLELLEDHNHFAVEGFVDDFKTGRIEGVPVLGPISVLSRLYEYGIHDLVVCISLDLQSRERISQLARSLGFRLPHLIHKSAIVSRGASIGDGALVFSFAVIRHGARVGELAIVKSSATVSYHAVVGSYCLLAPYVFLGSYSSLGEKTSLLLRATVRSRCHVGANSTVYPHAYVNESVPADSIAFGVPAQYEPRN